MQLREPNLGIVLGDVPGVFIDHGYQSRWSERGRKDDEISSLENLVFESGGLHFSGSGGQLDVLLGKRVLHLFP